MIVIEFTGGTEEVFLGQAIYIEQRKEKNKCNRGYVFINLTDPAPVIPFCQAFKRMQWVETVEEMQQFLMLRWRESYTQGPPAWSNLKTEDMHVIRY